MNQYRRRTEKPITKLYYTIAEVGQIVNASPSAVRFWLKEFGIEVDRVRQVRRFREKDLNKLRNIQYYLQIRGFTIRGAKEEIAHRGYMTEMYLSEIMRLRTIEKTYTQHRFKNHGNSNIEQKEA